MSWVTPFVFVAGTPFTAAQANTYISGNTGVNHVRIADDGELSPFILCGAATKTHADTGYVIGTGNASERFLFADASGGALTLKLPASPVKGRHAFVKKTDSSTTGIVIDGNGKNIDGASTFTIPAQYNAFGFTYNGTEWSIF